VTGIEPKTGLPTTAILKSVGLLAAPEPNVCGRKILNECVGSQKRRVENGVSVTRRRAKHTNRSTIESAHLRRSGSLRISTRRCFPSREGSALFAVPQTNIVIWRSTTATKQGVFAGYCADAATSRSESSTTTRSLFLERFLTFKTRKSVGWMAVLIGLAEPRLLGRRGHVEYIASSSGGTIA
jgi:hypothetical protein